ncbi:hypothetical protein C8T65DRAFT_742614 [Cerioporus squamosus]|nr:hypothetical protein C8T65DRAFT_742614 [Cerioporus squamosus]
MSRIMKRGTGLPSELTEQNAADQSRELVTSTPEPLDGYDSEVPVASDDEGTISGPQKVRMQEGQAGRQTCRLESADSSTLPSSSPLRYSSTEIPDDDADEENFSQVTGFEEGGPGPFEDGEIREGTTPPGNQQRTFVQQAHWTPHGPNVTMDERYTSLSRSLEPSHRKRHWGGSQGSEEQA